AAGQFSTIVGNDAAQVFQMDLGIDQTGTLSLTIQSSAGNAKTWTVPGPLSLNTWYQVAAACDGTVNDNGVEIYLNGIKQTPSISSSGSPAYPVSAGNLAIGRAGSTDGQYLDGLVDHLLIVQNRPQLGNIGLALVPLLADPFKPFYQRRRLWVGLPPSSTVNAALFRK